jgi:hypothetical protein
VRVLSVPAAPDLVVSIPVDGKGMAMSPPVEFSPDESVMFVSVVTQRAVPFKWWKEHQADVGAGVLLLVLLIATWWARRVWRRPRAAGRWYCRHCNYDVTRDAAARESAPAATVSQCPECGSGIGPATSVAGTTRIRRLIPVALTTLLIGGLCLWRINAGLTTATLGKAAWPLDAVRRVIPGWPLARIELVDEWSTRVRCFDTRTWRELGVIEKGWSSHRSTPRGDCLLWTEQDAANGWNNDLIIAPTNGTPPTRVRLGTNSDGFASLVGFTGDGREALVVMNGLIPPPTYGSAAPPDGTTTVRLLGIDLSTFAIREISRIRAAAIQNAPNQWSIPNVGGAAEGGASGAWAMLVMTGPDAPKLVRGGPGSTNVEQWPRIQILLGSAQGVEFVLRRGAFAIGQRGRIWFQQVIGPTGEVTSPRLSSLQMVLDRGDDPALLLRVPLPLWIHADTKSLDLAAPRAVVEQVSESPSFRYRAAFSAVTPAGVATAAELRVFDMKRIADGERVGETPPSRPK